MLEEILASGFQVSEVGGVLGGMEVRIVQILTLIGYTADSAGRHDDHAACEFLAEEVRKVVLRQ